MSRESEKIFDGITQVSDETIIDLHQDPAEKARTRNRRRIPVLVSAAAAVVALAVLLNFIFTRGTLAVYALSEAEYPKEWSYVEIDDEGIMDDFMAAALPEMLQTGGEENAVWSPVSVYLSLSMLAELTDGSTRQEILDLLGGRSIEEQRDLANRVWLRNYRDTAQTRKLLASSVWLNEDLDFNEETLNLLADNYFTSSYRGKMGSGRFNRAFASWLDEETKGKLDSAANPQGFTEEDVFGLAQTVYFRAEWAEKFKASDTKPDTFHAKGGDIVCDFMHQQLQHSNCYGAENFTAVVQVLNFNSMYYILPDEGVTPEELLSDPEFLSFMTRIGRGDEPWPDRKYMKVNLAVPKFDVSSNMELSEHLKHLGVREVFDSGSADFSPLTEDSDVWLTRSEHAVRVKIDEKGCEGAAYIKFIGTGAALPPEDEMDFTIDRPFIFAVTGQSSVEGVLFLGIVNQPE